ncbi:hypothetical protein L218DRAFT_872062, partial [Marasmius fiardii PR-910]
MEVLLELSSGQVALTLRVMHSVLNIQGREDSIHPHHSSFTEFLYDQTCSKEFFIDRSSRHHFLALQWLKAL